MLIVATFFPRIFSIAAEYTLSKKEVMTLKKTMVILGVLGVFWFSPASFAGMKVYGDCTNTTLNSDAYQKVYFLTLGGEAFSDDFIIGAFFSGSTSMDPEPVSPFDSYRGLTGIYVGSIFVNDKSLRLAGIGGIYYSIWELTEGRDVLSHHGNSLAVGIRGNIKSGCLGMSLQYLTGISNRFSIKYNEWKIYESPEPGFSLFELKGGCSLDKDIKLYLIYRKFRVLDKDDDYGCSGCGLGIHLTL